MSICECRSDLVMGEDVSPEGLIGLAVGGTFILIPTYNKCNRGKALPPAIAPMRSKMTALEIGQASTIYIANDHFWPNSAGHIWYTPPFF